MNEIQKHLKQFESQPSTINEAGTKLRPDQLGPDQLGPVRVGSGWIDSDQQKINKLRNILNFYLIVGLIPLRNGPFTRHFDF